MASDCQATFVVEKKTIVIVEWNNRVSQLQIFWKYAYWEVSQFTFQYLCIG